MDKGRIQQIGTPTDIYNEPKNRFVAKFIGESNIIEGLMLEDYKVEFAGNVFPCVDKGFGKNESVDIVIRPEDLDIVPTDEGQITGRVINVTFKGVHYEMEVQSGDYIWTIHSTIMKDVDTEIGMMVIPDNIHIMKRSDVDED
jgi:spermidine/putrescine transport system ATP-binding protein